MSPVYTPARGGNPPLDSPYRWGHGQGRRRGFYRLLTPLSEGSIKRSPSSRSLSGSEAAR